MSDYAPTESDKLVDRIYKTPLKGLLYLDHPVYADDRGYFSELALFPDLEQALGGPFTVKQVNLARSNQQVCRGFHAEPWRKLISVITGTIYSAIADIRPDSPTFKQTVTFYLGEKEDALHGCFFLDQGLANSYCVTDGPVSYLYCVDQLYRERNSNGDGAIALFDPDLNVTWPIDKDKLIISDRDRHSASLRQKFPNKFKK